MDESLLGGSADRAGEPVKQQEPEDPPRRDDPRERRPRDADRRAHEQHLRDELHLAVVVAVGEDAAVQREERERHPVREHHHPEPERSRRSRELVHEHVADHVLHAVTRGADPAEYPVPAERRNTESLELDPSRSRPHAGPWLDLQCVNFSFRHSREEYRFACAGRGSCPGRPGPPRFRAPFPQPPRSARRACHGRRGSWEPARRAQSRVSRATRALQTGVLRRNEKLRDHAAVCAGVDDADPDTRELGPEDVLAMAG